MMATARTAQPYAGTQSVMRALALLEHFSDIRPEWTVAELARVAGLNRTTAYRLLTALESAALVEREAGSDAFRLGVGLIVLGGRAQRAHPVREVAHPWLHRLAAGTGESATLEIRAQGDMLTIDEVVGERLSADSRQVGTRWPLFASSTGRALLAALPAAEALAWLPPDPLPLFTPAGCRLRQELLASLAEVHALGYCVALDQLEIGYVGIAAAIHDAAGRPAAALCVGGPSARMTPETWHVTGTAVAAAAQDISARLGFRPSAL
jgi:IclR family acetate operon transcriptional repressor